MSIENELNNIFTNIQNYNGNESHAYTMLKKEMEPDSSSWNEYSKNIIRHLLIGYYENKATRPEVTGKMDVDLVKVFQIIKKNSKDKDLTLENVKSFHSDSESWDENTQNIIIHLLKGYYGNILDHVSLRNEMNRENKRLLNMNRLLRRKKEQKKDADAVSGLLTKVEITPEEERRRRGRLGFGGKRRRRKKSFLKKKRTKKRTKKRRKKRRKKRTKKRRKKRR